jgi:hypothetical protein
MMPCAGHDHATLCLRLMKQRPFDSESSCPSHSLPALCDDTADGGVLFMSQRFSEYARKERDDYPTPPWVTETVIAHLRALNVTSIWEPAAGEGAMAAVLAGAGFTITATDLSGGINFLDGKTWPRAASCCDAIVTNPPYGLQGKLAERFIERALDLMRPGRGVVAMLLKVDFDSGLTRRRFFADCPAWRTKLVLLKRIEWFKSLTGNTPSDNHAWYIWWWRHDGAPRLAYGP